MSDRMTSCHAPGHPGLAATGRLTRSEMIAQHRAYYERQLRIAQEVLATPDDQLIVETYTGVWAQNNKKVVEE